MRTILIVANINKEITHLDLLKSHIEETYALFDSPKKKADHINIAIIEPPALGLVEVYAKGWLNDYSLIHSTKPKDKRYNEKIVLLSNKPDGVNCPISYKITGLEESEDVRILSFNLTLHNINHSVHVIHNLDLMNHHHLDYERNIRETLMFNKIQKDCNKGNHCIVVGDFNCDNYQPAINSSYGLNSSLDFEKSTFCNLTNAAINNTNSLRTQKKANPIGGSYYFSKRSYHPSKWRQLDQIHVTWNSPIAANPDTIHFLDSANPGHDLILKLMSANNKFDHLPIVIEA